VTSTRRHIVAAMDYRLYPAPDTPGWAWIEGRPDVPGVVAMLRRGGSPFTIGPEAVREVREWAQRVGWRTADAPVRLVPVRAR
jgi:hypothetical protein